MSVDAINGANAQQTQTHSALPGAVAGGVGLGAAGALGGYFLGGKRPSLEEVFKQAPDIFKSEAVTKKDAEAAKTLQDAAQEYKNAGANEKSLLRKANGEMNNAIATLTVENQDKLQEAIDKAQETLNNKEVKIGDKTYKAKDIANELKEAQAEFVAAKNGTDAVKAEAVKKLAEARVNAQTFNSEAKKEMDAVREATKALRNARTTEFNKLAENAGSQKTLKEAATKASENFNNVKSSKLSELVGKKEITEAFEKIKNAIPKEGKTKMALIVGGIAAAVGFLGNLLLGNRNA